MIIGLQITFSSKSSRHKFDLATGSARKRSQATLPLDYTTCKKTWILRDIVPTIGAGEAASTAFVTRAKCFDSDADILFRKSKGGIRKIFEGFSIAVFLILYIQSNGNDNNDNW